jgi:predicted NBD/HSP70 family sugar kinase
LLEIAKTDKIISMTLAIDIGGTKTLVEQYDDKNELIYTNKFPTPPDYPEFLVKLKDCLRQLEIDSGAICVIALPAKIDRQTHIAESFGNLNWENIDIVNDLSSVLSCEIIIENDTKLAAIHAADSVRDKYSHVLYVTISTGIGTALVIDGVLDDGVIESELGHMYLEHEGEMVMWERFASGSAILNKYGKLAKDITSEADWSCIAHNIALGIHIAIAAYAPECIMLGGGVSEHFDKFNVPLLSTLEKMRNPMLESPVIMQTPSPEKAVILGELIYAKKYINK